MTKLSHRLFGEVDPANDDCREAEVDFAGRPVAVDLNLDEGKLKPAVFARVMRFRPRRGVVTR